ncbi:hypothetical protein PIB30_014033 [Stylosanthes scabra]|uniref:Uncharacterized protein n=1 Tax=Stylosanthes scabra TaxID=79078 RepID=A0ABU6Z6X5_9FABA|nr:hypothetical protein [Stylosanthes scabra]
MYLLGFGTPGVTGRAKTEDWRPNIGNSCPELGRTECSDLPSCRIAPSRGVRADLKSYLHRLGEEVALSSSGGGSSFGPSCVASCPELGGSRDFVFPYRGKDLFKALVGRSSVLEAKWHGRIAISVVKGIGSRKRHLPNQHVGKGESFLRACFIEVRVIHTHPPLPVSLFYEDDIGQPSIIGKILNESCF